MKASISRVILAIGVALFVAGWGKIRYADRRMESGLTAPGRKLCAGGVGGMAPRTGDVAFGLPCLSKRRSAES